MKTLICSMMALTVVRGAVAAQVTTAPVLGPGPSLVLPTVERRVLANGLTVVVSRNAEVPIVEGRLIIDGGQRLTGTPAGLATFTGTMLTEGAGGRDALKLAEEISFLGASINAGAGWESFVVSLRTPKRNVDQALALMADIVLRPGFASADVKRQRDLRLAAMLAAKDQPAAVANRVFYRNVFPADHPYHAELGGDSASVSAFDSASVRHFWQRAADPRHATLVLTGDVTLAEATAWATRHFADWRAPGSPLAKPPAGTVPAAPRLAARVILVDKPDAAQSIIYVGGPGVPRLSSDYPALALMNAILGGSFSSRLNDILREQLGYTYGAGSRFDWQPVPGPFMATSAVRTNVTDSSLAVIFREIRKIRTEPISETELVRGKHYIVLGALSSYETAGQVAGAISSSIAFGRPLSQLPAEYARIDAMTAADLQRVADTYLDPARMTVVVVGDLARIRTGIEKLNLGPIEVQTY